MKKEKMNLFDQIIAEYKQVQWPSKAEVFQVTIVVLLITLFVSLMILIFDFGFTTFMDRFSSIVKSLFS
ncbi:preprotein translocase subunit SecE [Streptobacillus moniliformis]|uniref:preprotein translocase subunit SecE n=1 Tax=Streptobacillus moniliformis TaxID=34105 RepID=UPI000A7653EA|nr:preprotein translocase subunit SecE [Streptobacillus moniliformis]